MRGRLIFLLSSARHHPLLSNCRSTPNGRGINLRKIQHTRELNNALIFTRFTACNGWALKALHAVGF